MCAVPLTHALHFIRGHSMVVIVVIRGMSLKLKRIHGKVDLITAQSRFIHYNVITLFNILLLTPLNFIFKDESENN